MSAQPTQSLPTDVANVINIERLLMVSRHQPVAAVAHLVNAGILVFASWSGADHIFLTGTLVLFAMAAVWQLVAWWRNRDKPRPRRVSDRTIRRITWWALAFGMLWGAFTSGLMYQQPSPELLVVICAVVVGISAGGYLMLYAIPSAMMAFIAFSILPPWSVLLMRSGTPTDFALAAYAMIFLGFLFVSARQAHKIFVTGVTLRLQNADLAYKADAANRAKSRFLANMSHELRTPLNAINGFAEIIQHQFKGPVGNPQYLDFAKAILDSGRHLVALIDDILDISKVESGRATLEEQTTHPQAVIDQVLQLTQSAADKASLKLESHLQRDLPDIYVDERKICQVLLNLVSNAVKFTPPGGRIRLEARRSSDGGLSFLVGDTGMGIPADEITEVLKPFMRSKDVERRQMQGTGLGLHLAQELMKLHGGSLMLNSTPGEGTIVTVSIPPSRILPAARQQAVG
jgi:signal transduction histidine kinase